MKRKIFIFLLAFLIPIINVNAYYCKNSEISRYKGLASNIGTFYEYQEDGNKLTFSITLVNLSDELYIVDVTNNKKYIYENEEITISGYSPGVTVKYNVYAVNENCSDDLLYTIRVVLPNYNPYYSDSICEGLDDYILCQKWHKHNLSYKSFVNSVNKYRESLVEKPIEEIPSIDPQYGLLDAILDVVSKYYYIILITIIIVCSIGIYINNKKSDIYR